MIALWLSLLSSSPLPPATPIPPAGRIYSSPTLHIGLRPQIFAGPGGQVGSGLTLQVSSLWLL